MPQEAMETWAHVWRGGSSCQARLGSASEHHQLQPHIHISPFIVWKELSRPSETWQIWSPIKRIYVRKAHQALLHIKRQTGKSWKDQSTIAELFIPYSTSTGPAWDRVADEYKINPDFNTMPVFVFYIEGIKICVPCITREGHIAKLLHICLPWPNKENLLHDSTEKNIYSM